jgi:MFS family permease
VTGPPLLDSPAGAGRIPPFLRIWFGQTVSLVGSGLTTFALGVWVYQRTGSATEYALIFVFSSLPGLLLLPFTGTLVDWRGRRSSMLLADGGSGLRILVVAMLYAFGHLEIWHVLAAAALHGAFEGIQFAAYASAIPRLVPKNQLGRANGLVQLSQSIAFIVSPLIAGALLPILDVPGLLLLDFLTFLVAVATLLTVAIPESRSSDGEPTAFSWWRSSAEAWGYLRRRSLLVRLLGFFALINLLVGAGFVLLAPLVLSFASPQRLAVVLSIGSGGAVVGSLVMSVWGGPRRRIRGVLGAAPLLGLCLILIGLRASAPWVACWMFWLFFFVPIINGSDQSIWQAKVDFKLQGRVFALRRMIARSTAPVAYLAAGPLSDQVFDPLLRPGGPLASTVGQVIGTGAGRGIGLLFVVMGGIQVVATLAYSLSPRLRHVEDLLPDAPAGPL